MEWTDALILIFSGLFAGFINTMAGGGSVLTIAVLIFMGLPPAEANATNRVGVVLQTFFASKGFWRKRVGVFPYALWLGISATIGAIIGAQFAVDIKGELFNKILAIVMILVVLAVVFKPKKMDGQLVEKLTRKHQFIGVLVFFFIGIYGGFIQAGVGFLIIATLSLLNGLNLVKVNSVKVFVVMCYTLAAVVVFIMEGLVNWSYGIVLALGTSAGGWIGSQVAVAKGDHFIKWVLVIVVIVMAVRLWMIG